MENTSTLAPFDWDGAVKQIHDTIGTETAIFDKFGLILTSEIPQFTKGSLISPTILDFIDRKTTLSLDLQLKNINCLVLEGDQYNVVFTFGSFFNFMSIVPKKINLAQFMPSISKILTSLHQTHESKTPSENTVELLSLDAEFQEMQDSTKREVEKDRFTIFKHLITYLSKK